MFRVVQDQLKVSEGWVRCGRCEAVFNAQENLFDLEHDTPPPWQPPPVADPVLDPEHFEDDPATAASLPPDDVDEPPISSESTELASALPPALSPTEPELLQADADSAMTTDAEVSLDDPAATEESSPEPAFVASDEAATIPIHREAASTSAEEDAPSEITPAFMQQAQRRERWEQPPVRRMLWALVAASTLLLGAQVIHHSRQVIATQSPNALPWLEGFCEVANCRIDALQRIDDVSIENTALTQGPRPAPAASPASSSAPDDAASAPDGDTPSASDNDANVLRLSITLRNRGEWTVAMPSVDLSLTGSDGELVARRSLSPLDFGISDPRLLAGLDTPLSLRFRVAGGRVSGYTVEVFYP